MFAFCKYRILEIYSDKSRSFTNVALFRHSDTVSHSSANLLLVDSHSSIFYVSRVFI